MRKTKLGILFYALGFGIGLATLFIDVIPIIAVGAIIFCPYYAIKNFKKYRILKTGNLKMVGSL